MTERYFEDFAVGQVFKPSGRVRIEKEDIVAFAQKFDPQPFHLDEEAARHSMFGRLVARMPVTRCFLNSANTSSSP